MKCNSRVFNKLSRKILISSPYILDGIFNKALVFVLSHDDNGAIGLIFNHVINNIEVKSFFKFSHDIEEKKLFMPLYLGGVVEHDKGFFLHPDDYDQNLFVKFQNHLSLSSNNKFSYDFILKSLAKDSLFIIGYSSWKAGQLEDEIKNNLWIITDEDKELIFAAHPERKWHIALEKVGIHCTSFYPRIGYA